MPLNRARVADVRRLFRDRGQQAWLDLVLRYGRVFRLQNQVVVCEPEIVRTLLMRRVHTERRSLPHRVISRLTPGSRGLLFMDGELWVRHLRAVTPTFRIQHVERFAEQIYQATMTRAQQWMAQGELADLFTAVSEMGVEHVLRVGYGLDPKHGTVKRLGQHLLGYKMRTMDRSARNRIDQFGFTPDKLLDLPWAVQTYLDLRRRMLRLRPIVRELLTDSSASCDGPGWLGGLRNEGLPLSEVTDEVNHLYGAYNAVDFIITAALYELSRHPEWRDRVRAELDQQLQGRPPRHQDFSGLRTTMNVMRETLRLYPVAMGIYRQTGEPLAVDGEVLPAGTQVVILPFALHRHPDFWPDAETFNPDRWAASDEPPVPFSYIPFLEGPRKCIGRDLAELEFVTVLAALVGCWDVEVLDQGIEMLPFVIPRFERELPARVQRRAS